MRDTQALYYVRQYRPAFVTGYKPEVVRDVPYDKIMDVPWAVNFIHTEGFERCVIEADSDQYFLLVKARLHDGSEWVVSGAVKTDDPRAITFMDSTGEPGTISTEHWQESEHVKQTETDAEHLRV